MPTDPDPAVVARQVLTAALASPYAFNMASWYLPAGTDPERDTYPELAPGAEPDCGTTMCAAGWAAHLNGWTLAKWHARKDGHTESIERVGTRLLGLTDDQARVLFHASEPAALVLLEEIADRRPFDYAAALAAARRDRSTDTAHTGAPAHAETP